DPSRLGSGWQGGKREMAGMITPVDTASAMSLALRATWPNQRFTVNTVAAKHMVVVAWRHGPPIRLVQAVADQFVGRVPQPDGTISWHATGQADEEPIYDVQTIRCDREHPRADLQEASRRVLAKYGVQAPAIVERYGRLGF